LAERLVAKSVNNNKAMRCQLEELQRHAKQDRGLYLNSYKQAKCNNEEKKKRQRVDKNALGCNYQHAIGCARETYACTLKIFMRTSLLTSGARRNESGMVNLVDAMRPGTYWVAYAKKNARVLYFDNFGIFRSLK